MHCGNRLFLCVALCVTSLPLALTAESSSHTWITMFNGQDLSGWKANPENPDSFHVEDGVLVVDGPRCHLFWIGDPENSEDEQLTNFHWHAKVKTMPKANGGLYFHTQYEESGWPSAGYECQVNQTHKDQKKLVDSMQLLTSLIHHPSRKGSGMTTTLLLTENTLL